MIVFLEESHFKSILHLKCEALRVQKDHCWRFVGLGSASPPTSLRPGPFVPRLVPGATKWTLEDLVVFLGRAPVSEQARIGAGAPLRAGSPKGSKGEGWTPRGVSILEALPAVRGFLVQCSGRFPNIQGETLGASGALQAHLVQTTSAVTWGKVPRVAALSQIEEITEKYIYI